MLTGATPFAGRSAQSMLAAHVTEAPLPLARKCPTAPAWLASLIMQCLEKEQGDRPRSASAVLEALETISGPSAIVRMSEAMPKPVIAVLPLANIGPSADDEYFSDGVSEDIIAQLSRIAELQVIARTSVMRYKKTDKRTREIGTDLGATHIVEGSLRRAGQKLRIVAKLVDSRSEATLWTDTYDRELADVFAIQTEVAERVTVALKERLAIAPRARPARRKTADSLQAYDIYLRGRFEFNKGTQDGLRQSIDLCERAVAIDPSYADPHVVIAAAHTMLAVFGGGPAWGMESARTHATRALDLDPELPEAYAAIAYIHFWFDWNWSEADRCVTRAIELGPNSATAHDYLARFLAHLGHGDDAVAAARRTVELDPLWSEAHFSLGWALFQAGRFAESVAACDRGLELAPGYALSLLVKGCALIELDQPSEAVAMFERCLAVSPGMSMSHAGIIWALVRRGDHAAARQALNRLLDARVSLSPSALAWAYAAIGEVDAAFQAIERMIAERDATTVSLARYVWWDPLRQDPRFDAILRRLRFPDSSLAVSDARRVEYAERRQRSNREQPTQALTPE
jgi:TolB-like protein/Tfp pilus assembly protein PilF